jgi:homopolymeric O-antigen transport system permease protein
VNSGFELTAAPATTTELVRNLWRSRELVFMLSRKEFFVKFRRTSGGLLWSIALPVVQATLMAAVLSRFVRFSTDINYAVFIYSGMLAYNFVQSGIIGGVGSIVDGSNLSTKIYFPRLVLPLVVVGAGFYSLLPGLAVMLSMAEILDQSIGVRVLLLVPAVGLMCLFTASLAAVLSMCQVYVRDSRYIVGALLQPLLYLTPVLYPVSAVERYRVWLQANPVTGIVEAFRSAIGNSDAHWTLAVGWTIGWTAFLSVLAVALFRRYDRVAVDLL